MVEIDVKLTDLVTQFDISKKYIFSKERYVKFHKLDLQQCSARYGPKAWLDIVDEQYVKPLTRGNGVIKYLKPNGQPERLMVLPQECCEVVTMRFKMKGE